MKQYISHNLSADARTLLKTPSQTHILKICEEEYLYFDLHDIIQKMLLKDNNAYMLIYFYMLLYVININDLSLAKSSQTSL